jgi:hypothetical protein
VDNSEEEEEEEVQGLYNKDLENLEEGQVLFDKDRYFGVILILFDKGLVPEGEAVQVLDYMGLLNQGDADHDNKDQGRVGDHLNPLNKHYLNKLVSGCEEFEDCMLYRELVYQLEHDDLNLKPMKNALNFSFL